MKPQTKRNDKRGKNKSADEDGKSPSPGSSSQNNSSTSKRMLDYIKEKRAREAAIASATKLQGAKWAKPESALPKRTVMQWSQRETGQFLEAFMKGSSRLEQADLEQACKDIDFLCNRTQVDLRMCVEDYFDPEDGVKARCEQEGYEMSAHEERRLADRKEQHERRVTQATADLRQRIQEEHFEDLWRARHKAQAQKLVADSVINEATEVLKRHATLALRKATQIREYYQLAEAIKRARKEKLVDSDVEDDALAVLREEFKFLKMSEQQKIKRTPGAVR